MQVALQGHSLRKKPSCVNLATQNVLNALKLLINVMPAQLDSLFGETHALDNALKLACQLNWEM